MHMVHTVFTRLNAGGVKFFAIQVQRLFIPEVMKTGSANLNFLRNFSQLSLSNISLGKHLQNLYTKGADQAKPCH